VIILTGTVAIGCGSYAVSGPPLDMRAAATPRCFGAAARDRVNPCTVAHALRFVAVPTPDDAALEPSAPCRPIDNATPPACWFGAARADAVSSVALLGDSHARAWRAAVAVVAHTKDWHGVSLDRHECPFTFAITPHVAGCKGWARGVVRWLRKHPEVHQVIVGANSESPVIAANGHTLQSTKIKGYIDAWHALPRSVHFVFVLRDAPHSDPGTADCVSRSIARHNSPARNCALPRRHALRTDESAMAARRANSQRVSLVDLSSFMCDHEQCFPVVGGALVIKDIGHLTRTFAATLGPYLDRAITRVQRQPIAADPERAVAGVSDTARSTANSSPPPSSDRTTANA
jgi:hypothetical protein